MNGVLPGHMDGVLPGHMGFCPGIWIRAKPHPCKYGRVFPSKTLRNVLAFAWANARAKAKGGGVIPESGREVGVAWM